MQAVIGETVISMRMAILAYPLRVAGGLSVGTNVIAALHRVADQHEYLLLMPAGVGYEAIEKPSRATCRYYRRTRGAVGQLLYEKLTVPRLVRSFRPDLIWGLGNFGLTRTYAKQAILVQKAHLIYEPQHQQREAWRLRIVNQIARRRLKKSLRVTQLVFCQTKTAAERFRRTFDFNGTTRIMPNAVSRVSAAGNGERRPAVFEKLQGRFVLLCLTKYYAHKNLESLITLFRDHAGELSDVTILLTVAKDQHPSAGRFMASLEVAALREHLVNVGPIDQSELAGYFAHCDGLILPTLLESFSGTYLEAMRFSRPILTSDLDFARDVCGPAALYFDPFAPASIRDAILELKSSPKKRQALVAAGAQWFELFVRDWDSIVTEATRELEALVACGEVGLSGHGSKPKPQPTRIEKHS